MYNNQNQSFGNLSFVTTTDIKMENNSTNIDANQGGGDSNQQSIDKTKLIVNYIPQFATEEDLAQLFAPIGKVENIKIMRDFKTGYSFGFGFVKYFKQEDAVKAIETLNGISFRGKRLKVSYSRPPGADMKDANLYITNLPKDVTEEDIDNLFKQYGEIVQRTVLKDKITGMPRGVAFVRYTKGEEAQAAIAGLDGTLLEKSLVPLSVRVAEDHGRQKAQYLDVWNPGMYNRGFPPIRGIPSIREMNIPRGNFQNRYGRYPQFNNLRNMGAGDNLFQNMFYY